MLGNFYMMMVFLEKATLREDNQLKLMRKVNKLRNFVFLSF